MIRIASFDIGKKNFSFYIEEFDSAKLLEMKPLPKWKRYNENGECTLEMEKLLKKIYLNGKTILHKNLDLTENCDKKAKLDPETFFNMNSVLDSHILYFDTCSAFVIEQQMSFGRKVNTMALKLGQHCYSYFLFRYGRVKEVVEFPAYHKTQILGAEKVVYIGKKRGKEAKKWKAMEKRNRKKWSVEKAKEILEMRGESEILLNLRTVKKRDDLADTLTQLQAFKYLLFVER